MVHGVDITRSRLLHSEAAQRALRFAERAHAGQFRKTGERRPAAPLPPAAAAPSAPPRPAARRRRPADASPAALRRAGEPYVAHCVETALIVERNLPRVSDSARQEAAVVAALLHDVLDDTATDLAELQEEWAPGLLARWLPAAGCLLLGTRCCRLERSASRARGAAGLRIMRGGGPAAQPWPAAGA